MKDYHSRYANPDRYIDRLKAEILRQKRIGDFLREDIRRLRGETIVEWNDGVTSEESASGTDALGDFHLGDKIAIEGLIEKSERYYGADKQPCSRITFGHKYAKLIRRG